MSKQDFFIKESELDDDQFKILNGKINKSTIVKGCAGSGKSILSLWKAKQIVSENKGTYYFIVYTKVLRAYMSAAIKQIGLDPSRVDYYNHWRYKINESDQAADYIIVDEAQDFNQEALDYFTLHARKAIFLYGDSSQQLYKFRQDLPMSMEEIESLYGYHVDTLQINHRLTKKIARVAKFLNTDDNELVERCINEGIEKPKILKYDSFDAELDAIIDIVNNKHLEDVGILLQTNQEIECAQNYFRKRNFFVEIKSDKEINLNFLSDNPKLMTIHSSKGLQFENVFIPNCNAENEDWARIPLYVAMTRSYRSLYIMYSGKISKLLDQIPVRYYDIDLSTDKPLIQL